MSHLADFYLLSEVLVNLIFKNLVTRCHSIHCNMKKKIPAVLTAGKIHLPKEQCKSSLRY